MAKAQSYLTLNPELPVTEQIAVILSKLVVDGAVYFEWDDSPEDKEIIKRLTHYVDGRDDLRMTTKALAVRYGITSFHVCLIVNIDRHRVHRQNAESERIPENSEKMSRCYRCSNWC